MIKNLAINAHKKLCQQVRVVAMQRRWRDKNHPELVLASGRWEIICSVKSKDGTNL